MKPMMSNSFVFWLQNAIMARFFFMRFFMPRGKSTVFIKLFHHQSH